MTRAHNHRGGTGAPHQGEKEDVIFKRREEEEGRRGGERHNHLLGQLLGLLLLLCKLIPRVIELSRLLTDLCNVLFDNSTVVSDRFAQRHLVGGITADTYEFSASILFAT